MHACTGFSLSKTRAVPNTRWRLVLIQGLDVPPSNENAIIEMYACRPHRWSTLHVHPAGGRPQGGGCWVMFTVTTAARPCALWVGSLPLSLGATCHCWLALWGAGSRGSGGRPHLVGRWGHLVFSLGERCSRWVEVFVCPLRYIARLAQ